MCYNIAGGSVKICVFTDIHGNYDALSLLVDCDDFKNADLRICLGDVVIMGPNPNECIETVLGNDCIWLKGNHDSYIAHGLPKEELKAFNEGKKAHQKYMSNLIKKEYKRIMKKLPKCYILEVNNKKMYFTHYIWKKKNNVVDCPETPTLENVSNIFKEIEADYIFYGHEHTFSHFKDLQKEYICIGSLGLKYPGHYSIIDIDERGEINIIHKIINFDINKYKDKILKAGYPRSEKCVEFFE